VVGIAKNDLRGKMGLEVDGIKRFDRSDGTDGHENRCPDGGVGSCERCGTVSSVSGVYLKMHYGIILD